MSGWSVTALGCVLGVVHSERAEKVRGARAPRNFSLINLNKAKVLYRIRTMEFSRIRKEWKAAAVLSGTTIGAGIFGIPYVVSKIGFVAGIIYLLVLGCVVLLLNLIYGEVILRTPGDHQMGGYVRIYLGKEKEILSIVNTFSFFISIYGALLVYLIKIGDFLALIFGGGNSILFSSLFFIFGSLVVYFGLRTISRLEFLIVAILAFSILLIAIMNLKEISWANLQSINLSHFLLPYGVILFALNGSSVIPEMEEILRKQPKKLKRTVIIGSAIPLFIYLVFTLLIVGICGPQTSEDSLSSLLRFLPGWTVKISAFLGILAMASSFLTLSYVLKESWFRDYKVSRARAFTLSCFPAFLLFLLGARSFIDVLEFSGAVSVGLSGILILLMFKKARAIGKRKPAYNLNIPNYFILFLQVVFLLGLLSPFLIRLKQ